MTEKVEEFIKHHGVKGMKWGVRGKRGSGKESSDFKKTKPLRNRKSSELTNKQLKDVNERVNLESNYSRLNPSRIKKGTTVAAEILATAGIAVAAYNLINSPAGKALVNLGKKRAGQQLKLFK